MRLLIVLPLLLLAGCAGSRVAGQKPSTFGDAAASPLSDINLLRTKIPTVLLDAMDAPYSLPNPLTCREIAAQVRPLDEALGPDLDAPPSLDDPSLLERGEEAARGAGVAVVRGAAQSVIPMRGWVRRLTGAETHDRLVLQAITAGAVRRGYLKGLGKVRKCTPPAAPQPVATTKKPAGVYPGLNGGPRYPIR